MMDGFDMQSGEIVATTAHSASIGQLAEALAKAQAKIEPPKKDKTAKVGTYSYSYADLASVIESIRKPLAEAGIAHMQAVELTSNGLVLATRLAHVSGEWIVSRYPLPTLAKPQEMGSALTYARRYSLCAILGIAAEEDDDGQVAQHSTNGNGHSGAKPPRTAAPKGPDDPETQEARRLTGEIDAEIKAAKSLQELNALVEARGPALAKIKAVSQSAYEALMQKVQIKQDAMVSVV